MNKKPISFNDFVTLYAAYGVYLDKFNAADNTEDAQQEAAALASPAVSAKPAEQPEQDSNKAVLDAIAALNKKIDTTPRPSIEQPKPLSVDDVIKKILD